MKVLEVLRAARLLIVHESNWQKGSLARYDPERDEECFCAAGAVLAAGGVIRKIHHHKGTVSYGTGVPWAHTSTTGVIVADAFIDSFWSGTCELMPDVMTHVPRDIQKKFAAIGADVRSTHRALNYLSAAARQLGYNSIVEANDVQGGGHKLALLVMDLAIKNAKRRHINGNRPQRGDRRRDEVVSYEPVPGQHGGEL